MEKGLTTESAVVAGFFVVCLIDVAHWMMDNVFVNGTDSLLL